MNMMQSVCHGCKDRTMPKTCEASCQRRQEEIALRAKAKKAMRKDMAAHDDYMAVTKLSKRAGQI